MTSLLRHRIATEDIVPPSGECRAKPGWSRRERCDRKSYSTVNNIVLTFPMNRLRLFPSRHGHWNRWSLTADGLGQRRWWRPRSPERPSTGCDQRQQQLCTARQTQSERHKTPTDVIDWRLRGRPVVGLALAVWQTDIEWRAPVDSDSTQFAAANWPICRPVTASQQVAAAPDLLVHHQLDSTR